MVQTGANAGFLPEEEFFRGDWLSVKHVVCIPASHEISLLPVLHSLQQCHPVENLGVLICINASEAAPEKVKRTNIDAFGELKNLSTDAHWFPLGALLCNHLPAKKAGVGLARKIGMDMAYGLTERFGKEAVLICLDADCAVEKNWAAEVINYFKNHPKIVAASIYFEHPFPEDVQLKRGIEKYELHLRYLKRGLQWAGYPWYYHTVGSSMALRAEAYKKSGGMNTRQAGEDFYFLHKLMPLGFGEINSTTVFPAARYSDRVPFGTGRSMLEFAEKEELLTYHVELFSELKRFFACVFSEGFPWEKNCGDELKAILEEEGIEVAIKEALEHSANHGMAVQRLKKWFSGFRIIRILHALREVGFPDAPVEDEAIKLLAKMGPNLEGNLLAMYRKLDKSGA